MKPTRHRPSSVEAWSGGFQEQVRSAGSSAGGTVVDGLRPSSPSVGRETLARWEDLAAEYGVAWPDVVLLALNLFGVSTPLGPRVRLEVEVVGEGVPRLQVVPSARVWSPFQVFAGQLLVGEVAVGAVRRMDLDDAVAGYLRCWDGRRWRAATLNPNARSRCTGCVFCPTVLEAAADPRVRLDDEYGQLLSALAAQFAAYDGTLSDLAEVTVSTGCFHTEDAAVAHLGTLRRVLTRFGVSPDVGLLTSVLRSRRAFDQIAAEVGPFTLWLTAECATRRDLILKHTKASLRPSDMSRLLGDARAAGLGASFTYVVGLDPLEDMAAFLGELLPQVSVWPSIQVLQAHTPLTETLRAPGADQLGYYLQARRIIEQLAEPLGVRPERWRSYRPLWFTTFAGQPLSGPIR